MTPEETQMTPEEFYGLVEKMRAAQRHFFTHRDNLRECKALERRVDEAIAAAHTAAAGEGRQQTLARHPALSGVRGLRGRRTGRRRGVRALPRRRSR